MTKKDYIKMANVFREHREKAKNNETIIALDHCIDSFCAIGLTDNPKFDRLRFKEACGQRLK